MGCQHMVLEHSSGSGFQMVVIIVPSVYSRYQKFGVHLYIRYVYVLAGNTETARSIFLMAYYLI